MQRQWGIQAPERALFIEFITIFVGLPLLVMAVQDRVLMIALLWGGAGLCYAALRRRYSRAHAVEWNWPGLRAGWRKVLLRFALLAPVLAGITALALPQHFLSFPSERPDIWMRVMIIYPLLSVWPQELIYRSFIRHRYEPLFGAGRGFIVASALAFGFMHVMFLNPVAVILCLLGGWMFARSYAGHHSLALACLEHTLYGCLVFTLGLGMFFYSGAAWS